MAAEQQQDQVRRRAWPVRAAWWLIRPFWDAVVAGVPDSRPSRPRWLTPRPPRPRWLTRRLPGWGRRRVDLVVLGEVLLAIAIFSGTITQLNDANDRAGDPVGQGELLIFVAAASSLPLLLRDRWPLAAWRVAFPSMIFVAVITSRIYGHQGLPDAIFPPPGAGTMYLLVLYSVAVRSPRHISVGVALLSALGMLVMYPSPAFFLAVLMVAAALLFGYNVRVRRQAQRQVVEEERRTEGERAARAVLEERSRIARELHDVVAHHMSVIAIQAEAAPIKAPEDPEVLKAELAGIRTTALAALTELRRVLGVLREGDQAPVTAPQPDLSELDQLVTSFRAAGQAVTVTAAGRPPATTGGVGLAAYRVLQESLSNALRHAPGAPVRVHLAYHDDRLSLRVENDPPPPNRGAAAPRSRGGGQGLTGMRERVGAFGGTLTSGPTPAGGFAVHATLPIEAPATIPPTPAEQP